MAKVDARPQKMTLEEADSAAEDDAGTESWARTGGRGEYVARNGARAEDGARAGAARERRRRGGARAEGGARDTMASAGARRRDHSGGVAGLNGGAGARPRWGVWLGKS